MKRRLDARWGLLAALLVGTACPGDDGDGDDSGSTAATMTTSGGMTQGSAFTSNGSAGTSTAPAEGSGSATDASTSTTTPPADSTGGDPMACGDMMCAAGEVCVTEEFEAPCENQDPQAPRECPPGTEPDVCGLAGVPCCCGEPPPPAEVCVPGAECGDEPPDCSCITCPPGKGCYTNVTDGSVSCGPPRP